MSSKEQVMLDLATLREDSHAETALGDAASRTRNIAVGEAAWSLRSLIRNDPETAKFAVEVGGIEALVTALKQRPNSVEVQKKATSALGHLAAHSHKSQSQAGDAGGVNVVVLALGEHPSSEGVQMHAAEALGRLAAKHQKNQALARSAGGIEAVVIAMEQHPKCETLQARAASALGSLVTGSPQSQRRAYKARGIEAVLAALKEHPSSRGVQEQAVDALGHLVAHSPESLAWSREVGAVASVVGVLRRMQSSEGVQLKALGALSKLVMNNGDNQKLAGEAGALEAVATALRTHVDREALQEQACDTAGHLVAQNAALQDLAREGGLIEVVIQALKQHPDNEAVLAKASSALGSLVAKNAKSQRRAGEAGAIEVLTGLLKSNPESEAIQEIAVGALMQVTADSRENQVQARDAGTLKAVIMVLRQHACNVAVQANASLALRNLVLGDPANMSAAVLAGGIDEVVSALQQSLEADGEQTQASLASEHREYQALARRAGLIEALIGALRQAPPKSHKAKGRLHNMLLPAPQVNMLSALGDLVAYNSDNQKVAGEAGGIEVVIAVLSEHTENEAVQEHALQALSDLIVANAVNQRRAKLADADRALLQTQLTYQQSEHVQDAAKAALEALFAGENFAARILATDFGKCHQKCQAIPDAAVRGITLAQLQELGEFIQDSLEKYNIVSKPREGEKDGASLTWDELNMYDIRDHFILPLTRASGCSYVEIVANNRQPPMWMVSHWWGTPFDFTLRMLEFQAKARYTHGASAVTYWCCTTANNQHDLSELDGQDVLKSPFARAMISQGCMGTVLLCDPEVTALMRIWCVLEAQVTQQLRCGVLSNRTDKKYFMDIVAPVAHQAADGEEVGVAMTMLQDAVGGSWNEVSDREGVFFPLNIARLGVAVDVLKAECSEGKDRNQILNYIAKGVSSKDEPPDAHPSYDRLNNFVHTVFNSAELYRLASEQPDGCVEAAARLLQQRADVNTFVRKGNTPLFAAAGADPAAPFATNAAQQRGLITMLLSARADANHANSDRKTVLDVSSRLPDEAREILLKYGAMTFQDAAPALELSANDQLLHILATGFGSEGQAFVGGDAGTRLSLAAERSLQAAATAVLKLYHWAPCRIGIQTSARRHQTTLAHERAKNVKLALESAGCLNTFVVYFGPQRLLLSLTVTIVPLQGTSQHTRGGDPRRCSAPRDGGDRRRREAPIRLDSSVPTSPAGKRSQGPRPESALSPTKKVAWTRPPTPGPPNGFGGDAAASGASCTAAAVPPGRQGGGRQSHGGRWGAGSCPPATLSNSWSAPAMPSLQQGASHTGAAGGGCLQPPGCIQPPADEPTFLPREDPWRQGGGGDLRRPTGRGGAPSLMPPPVGVPPNLLNQLAGQGLPLRQSPTVSRPHAHAHHGHGHNPLKSVQRSLRRVFSVADMANEAV